MTLEIILNMKAEEFIKLINSSKEFSNESLRKLLQAQYEQLICVKESLILIISKKDSIDLPKEDLEKASNTLEQIYIALQLIEDKFNILNNL